MRAQKKINFNFQPKTFTGTTQDLFFCDPRLNWD